MRCVACYRCFWFQSLSLLLQTTIGRWMRCYRCGKAGCKRVCACRELQMHDVRSSWRVAELRRKLSGTTKEKARGRLTAEERRTPRKRRKVIRNFMGRKLGSPLVQTTKDAEVH